MRFLRHLAAAAAAVAVVVLLGLAWNRFASGTLAGGLHGTFIRGVPPGAKLPGHVVMGGTGHGGPHGPLVIRNGPMSLGLSSMLNPVNLPPLVHAVLIEAGLIAAVVVIDIGRRRSGRARRDAGG